MWQTTDTPGTCGWLFACACPWPSVCGSYACVRFSACVHVRACVCSSAYACLRLLTWVNEWANGYVHACSFLSHIVLRVSQYEFKYHLQLLLLHPNMFPLLRGFCVSTHSSSLFLIVLQPNSDWGRGDHPLVSIQCFMTVFDTTWPIHSESGSSHSGPLGEIKIFMMASTKMKHIVSYRNVLSVSSCNKVSHLSNSSQWHMM